MCAMNIEIVMPNLAALRAAVFTLSGEKKTGGGADTHPPSVRGLMHVSGLTLNTAPKQWCHT